MTGKLSPTEHQCGIRSCAHHLYMHSDFTLSEWRLVFILNEGTQHVGQQIWNWSSTIWLQSQGVAQDSWVLEAQSHLRRGSWAPVLQRRVWQRLRCLQSSLLHRGVSLDLIFQAPLKPTGPHGDVLANEWANVSHTQAGEIWKMHVPSIISFPFASWTMHVGVSVNTKVVISPNGMAETKDTSTTLKESTPSPRAHLPWTRRAPKSLQTVTAAMKLKDACSLEEKLGPT